MDKFQYHFYYVEYSLSLPKKIFQKIYLRNLYFMATLVFWAHYTSNFQPVLLRNPSYSSAPSWLVFEGIVVIAMFSVNSFSILTFWFMHRTNHLQEPLFAFLFTQYRFHLKRWDKKHTPFHKVVCCSTCTPPIMTKTHGGWSIEITSRVCYSLSILHIRFMLIDKPPFLHTFEEIILIFLNLRSMKAM